MRVLSHLKNIEASVYPKHMQMLQDCQSLCEVADYAECEVSDLIIQTGNNWYCIIADHGDWVEIVDLASVGPMRDIFSLIGSLRRRLAGKRIVMDARKRTSYPLVRLLIRRVGGKILEDEKWYWNGDEMRSLTIQW